MEGENGNRDFTWSEMLMIHRFANGIIVRDYQPGGVMNITVDVTANHKGFFTFRMCPVVSEGVDPDQECFDRPENLLQVIDTVSDEMI